MKKELDFIFPYGNVSYPVHVTYKKMRRVIFRVKDGVIMVSSPIRLSHLRLLGMLSQMMPKLEVLLKREVPKNDHEMYLLGDKKSLVYGSKAFHITDIEIFAKDEKALERSLRKWGAEYLTQRVRYYETLMGVKKPYDVRLRAMDTRYGSNSRATHRLTFALKLIHYAPSIIDAIVVHELAHDFQFDHSAKFYQIIHQYCPNYKQEHLKLRKGMYR